MKIGIISTLPEIAKEVLEDITPSVQLEFAWYIFPYTFSFNLSVYFCQISFLKSV